MPLVELDGVGLEVTTPVLTRVLHPMNVEIEAGSSVAVVGPSGAGKTTLASIIGALQPGSEGIYLFQGEVINSYDANQRAAFRRDHIGFVFQNAHLIDERSAWRNVALGITDLRSDPEEVEQRSRDALRQVGLGGVESRLAALLSGGERQRVAVARALVKQPGLVIADEPTGALDQRNGNAILDLLFSLDTTLLMVTHDSKAASRSERIITIVDGRIE